MSIAFFFVWETGFEPASRGPKPRAKPTSATPRRTVSGAARGRLALLRQNANDRPVVGRCGGRGQQLQTERMLGTYRAVRAVSSLRVATDELPQPRAHVGDILYEPARRQVVAIGAA